MVLNLVSHETFARNRQLWHYQYVKPDGKQEIEVSYDVSDTGLGIYVVSIWVGPSDHAVEKESSEELPSFLFATHIDAVLFFLKQRMIRMWQDYDALTVEFSFLIEDLN